MTPARRWLRRGGPADAKHPETGRRSQTADLLRAYHEQGDTNARQQLVELYLPLVESFMRRYARGTDEYDDLYQIGCIGLINAIDRFELSRGEELAAFAVPNISGEIRRYQRDRSASVRLPRRVLELRTGAAQAQGELRVRLGRKPTTAEIARELGADEHDVAAALDAAAASQALELQPDDAETDERPLDVAEDRLFLSDAFRGLDDRERRIMFLRYVRDLEPDAIAAELRISRRQLARSTSEALEKLRVRLERPGAGPPGAAPSVRPEPLAKDATEPKIATMGVGQPAQRESYLDQPYHIELVKSVAPGSGWSAQVEELPGCVAQGATAEEAARGVEAAMRDWIADSLEHGREVPKPRSAASHSGRLLVRMPQSLHAELARAAEREEISLNQFITGSLAGAVHWRRRTDEPAAGDQAQPESQGVRTALMANVLLLAFIAALALALLVIAVSRG